MELTQVAEVALLHRGAGRGALSGRRNRDSPGGVRARRARAGEGEAGPGGGAEQVQDLAKALVAVHEKVAVGVELQRGVAQVRHEPRLP